MEKFIPKRVFFEPAALEYPLGKEIYEKLHHMSVDIGITSSHNRVKGIPGKTVPEGFVEAKRTLVVGVKKMTEFASCKPSANYQLPLNTSCPGMCEYCYLATTLGKKPYLRVYVNIGDILNRAQKYIQERQPEVTVFEGAATSDPIPLEYLTGLLRTTIEFFGKQPMGRFRFVTKYDNIDSLLTANHNGHTRFRFSLNAASVITAYEHGTPTMEQRVNASVKVAGAGYPLGFIVAPIFIFTNWQEEYRGLFQALEKQLPEKYRENVTFEFISHRFTKRAKNHIAEIFPHSVLPLDEGERKFKFGQFGYGKYIYSKEAMEDIYTFMQEMVSIYFPHCKVEYFV